MTKLPSVDIEIPRSLTDVVEDKIRQMIVQGELAFGEQITETQLSEMFNLSKTPIREALLRLSAGARLVEVKPRCGTFVFSLTEHDITHISTLRILLEQGAMRSALKHNHASLIAELGKNLAKSEKIHEKNNLSLYRSLDHAFHLSLVHYADNPYLFDIYNLISSKVLAMRNRITFSQDYIKKSISEHANIANALLHHRLDEACLILEEHIHSGFTERTRRLISEAS